MYVFGFYVLLAAYCIHVSNGGAAPSEKVHIKIHVPEFIKHHHHTKVVYLHKKKPLHHDWHHNYVPHHKHHKVVIHKHEHKHKHDHGHKHKHGHEHGHKHGHKHDHKHGHKHGHKHDHKHKHKHDHKHHKDHPHKTHHHHHGYGHKHHKHHAHKPHKIQDHELVGDHKPKKPENFDHTFKFDNKHENVINYRPKEAFSARLPFDPFLDEDGYKTSHKKVESERFEIESNEQPEDVFDIPKKQLLIKNSYKIEEKEPHDLFPYTYQSDYTYPFFSSYSFPKSDAQKSSPADIDYRPDYHNPGSEEINTLLKQPKRKEKQKQKEDVAEYDTDTHGDISDYDFPSFDAFTTPKKGQAQKLEPHDYGYVYSHPYIGDDVDSVEKEIKNDDENQNLSDYDTFFEDLKKLKDDDYAAFVSEYHEPSQTLHDHSEYADYADFTQAKVQAVPAPAAVLANNKVRRSTDEATGSIDINHNNTASAR